MRAEYDSEADALSIDVIADAPWDGSIVIHDTYCQVATTGGQPANVEILYPAAHPELVDELLEQAASTCGLDEQALKAAARSALEAPDRTVEIQVAERV